MSGHGDNLEREAELAAERVRCGGNALSDRAGDEPRNYPSYPINATILNEALDLLALWYGRWQGFVAGTPDDMQIRTRELLERTDRPPREMEVQR